MKAIVDSDFIPYVVSYRAERQGLNRYKALSLTDKYLKSIIEESDCDSFVLAASNSKSFRNDIFPSYKANRKSDKPGDNFYYIKDYLSLRYPTISIDGYEADDIIAALVLLDSDDHVSISCDKDLLQLYTRHYNPVTGNKYHVVSGTIKRNNSKVFATGEYCVGLLAIASDTADNIPGISKMGPIKAFNILNTVS